MFILIVSSSRSRLANAEEVTGIRKFGDRAEDLGPCCRTFVLPRFRDPFIGSQPATSVAALIVDPRTSRNYENTKKQKPKKYNKERVGGGHSLARLFIS